MEKNIYECLKINTLGHVEMCRVRSVTLCPAPRVLTFRGKSAEMCRANNVILFPGAKPNNDVIKMVRCKFYLKL